MPPALRARRVLRRIAVSGLVLVAVLAVIAALVLVWAVRRPWPQVEGEARLETLDGPVEVLRDDAGVPHLYAGSPLDLYRAQGYVHAQDRFWQMDVWRHVSAGRTAELFGPEAFASDRFLRTLGWARVAEAEYARLDLQTRAMLDAYAEGVNAYLADRPAGALGFEYAVLGLQSPGYIPAPWTPTDSLAFLKLMAWDLRSNLDTEIERAVLARTLSPAQLDELYPPYPGDAPVIVPGGLGAAGGVGDAAVGSNSWALTGEHTTSGAPVLANDPHLSIQMPSIWYEIGLHCTDACAEHVAGFSFAGVPGIVIGHNGHIAWGFTNMGADVMDLYLERVNPENPDQYEVDGEWADMEVRTETLRAADGSTEELVVRSTRHGPVISEVYGELDDVERPEGTVVALRWTALDPGQTMRALPAINRARNWAQFRAAARWFEVPAQNLTYADAQGNIGYQAPGRIPVRASGDGMAPAPGWTGDHDWEGFVPFEELPWALNPESGWIVTANNAVVGADYPYVLSREWDAGYRAQRIIELLTQRDDPVSLDDAQALQVDAFDPSSPWLVPALLDVEVEPAVAGARALLEDWDGQAAAGSAAAAFHAATWRHLLAATFHDQLPDGYRPGGGSRWVTVVRSLLNQPGSDWWDDAGTEGAERRDDMLALALTRAYDELAERLGDDPGAWRWGDLHTATFRNGTLGESGIGLIEARFNRGPYPVSGGSSIVNATAWTATEGYEVAALPSMRMVVDLGDPDRSRTVHTTGQSGHAYHPHYTDMTSLWQNGELRPLPWTRAAVETVAEHRLLLRP